MARARSMRKHESPRLLIEERVKETVVDQRDSVLIHDEIRESAG